MNVAPPGSGLPSARGDDTQGMRRHLLQDLERQWLNAWRVVDQAQTDAGPERTAVVKPAASSVSSAAPLPRDHSTAADERGAEAAGPQPRTTAQADRIAPSRQANNEVDAATASPSGIHNHSHRNDASPASSDRATMRSAEQAQAPQTAPVTANAASAEDASSRQAQPSQATEDDVRDLGLTTGLPMFAAVNLGNDEPGEPESFSLLAALPAELRTSGSTSLDQPAHVAATTVASATRAPAGGAPNPPNAKLEDGPDTDTSAASRQAKTLSSALDDQGKQRLMLRELSDQEVLASMRDAMLTPTQSQFAAQGLARALMEAGYARVQVVVNGKPALTTQVNARPQTGEVPSGSQSTTAPQDTHHGH